MPLRQAEFEVRCEWGRAGIIALAPEADVVVIVDVLSFTTAVDIATARGAEVLPYPERGESAAAYAAGHNAMLASAKRGQGFSLSPSSLRNIPPGSRLVLPSPNGAALSFGLDHPIVLAACLRNATTVAQAASRLGRTIAVIPAGETWPNGELRPCLEDLLGAGAVIAACPGARSPESSAAVAAFESSRGDLRATLCACESGKELMARGFTNDVDLAAELNVSNTVSRLLDGAFRGAGECYYGPSTRK